MSEIPARLADAIQSHAIAPRPAVPRTVAWHRRDDGAMAWHVEGDRWGLPSTGSEGAEVCRFVTPEGMAKRFDTRVVRAEVETASEWRSASDVLAAWEAGDLLLDPAARHAIDGDGIGGVEPAFGVRAVPLRAPTLPPATHTNCYFVGREEALVVDPGSPWPDELDRIARAVDRWTGRFGSPAAIFLTHHHGDHVGGAVELRRRTGLPIVAHPVTAGLVSFDVDEHIDDGWTHRGWTALFTPGHAPGHLCLHNPASGLILAGDMVASIGTIVVEPTEGDMGAYIAGLERLRDLDSRAMHPAHGDVIEDPRQRLEGYRAHRLWREAKIIAALEPGEARLADITKRAYSDVSSAILWLAERSTLAHLEKLEKEGKATRGEGCWSLAISGRNS